MRIKFIIAGFVGTYLLATGRLTLAQDVVPEKVYAPVTIREAPSNESTVVSLKDGTFKLFYINRPGEADKLMSINSMDGIRWNEPRVEITLPGTAYYANRVVEDADGNLHAIFHLWAEGNKGYRGRHLNLWYTRKNQGAVEWNEPVMIFEGYVGSIRNFMQLKSGRILASVAKAVPEREHKPAEGMIDYGWNEIITLYTDDSKTWHSSQVPIKIPIDPEKITRYGAVEPDIVEMNNGMLRMLIRTNKGRLYESWSDDAGVTWSETKASAFVSSDSPAAFLRLRDGRLLLFFNMNQRWDTPNSYAFGGREALHAAISSDDGKTWRGFREILKEKNHAAPAARGDRGTAYPSAVETSEGKILVASGQGESKSILLFDPAWLEDTQCVDSAPSDQITGTSIYNFPAVLAGSLTLKYTANSSCGSAEIALTDHFSIADDSLASKNGIFYSQVTLNKISGSIDLTWNTVAGRAEIQSSGTGSQTIGAYRQSGFGVNYLRVNTDPTCSFTVKSLKLKTNDR